MNKKLLITSIILGLAILAHLNSPALLANAQDFYDLCEPTMTPPLLLVGSPQNNSITNTSYISLIFNVSTARIIEMSPYITNTRDIVNSSYIGKVYYRGDWQTETQILYYNESEHLDFIEFDIILSDIPNGKHEVEVTASSEVTIRINQMGYAYHPISNESIFLQLIS